MNIHAQAPDFRLPCFLKRRLQYVSSKDFQGNPIILCCHHAMNEQDVCFLEIRATELANPAGLWHGFGLNLLPPVQNHGPVLSGNLTYRSSLIPLNDSAVHVPCSRIFHSGVVNH